VVVIGTSTEGAVPMDTTRRLRFHPSVE